MKSFTCEGFWENENPPPGMFFTLYSAPYFKIIFEEGMLGKSVLLFGHSLPVQVEGTKKLLVQRLLESSFEREIDVLKSNLFVDILKFSSPQTFRQGIETVSALISCSGDHKKISLYIQQKPAEYLFFCVSFCGCLELE